MSAHYKELLASVKSMQPFEVLEWPAPENRRASAGCVHEVGKRKGFVLRTFLYRDKLYVVRIL